MLHPSVLLMVLLTILVSDFSAAAQGPDAPQSVERQTTEASTDLLTAEERAWLKAHPTIRLGFNPHMEPLLIMEEDGSLTGIYPAIFGELEKILGISIDIEVDEWALIVQRARDRELDGLLACAPSQAEASSMLRTRPINMSYPVVFTRNDAPFVIESLNDLAGKRISYQQEVKMLEVVLEQYRDTSDILAVGNTGELIAGSVTNAEQGVVISKDVAESLGKISEGVTKVNDITAEVSTASQEQGQGIDQINTAVSQMDQVIQQNAANSEEGASAAEELSAQAAEMMKVVEDLAALVGGAHAGNAHAGRQSQRMSSAAHSPANRRGAAKALPKPRPDQSQAVVNPQEVIPLDDDDIDDF
jgi:hypothetical protein